MEAFYQFLSAHVKISEQDLNYISSRMHLKEFKKDSLVLRQGEVEKYLYFIEKGLARYFFTDQEGKEICFLFTFQNWFMGEVSSFLTKEPSICSIETLTDTRAWQIHYDDLQDVYANIQMGDRIGRLMMEQIYLRKAQREKSFLIQTAEQRYLDLMQKAPHILHQVSLKYISSYLGITPQALSRIRKRIN